MALGKSYLFVRSTEKICSVLGLSPESVVRRAGLPSDCLLQEDEEINAAGFFRLWDAIVKEASRPDLPLFLGKMLAQVPFVPAMIAFSCSPTVAIGLERVTVFKPLVGPIVLGLEKGDNFAISVSSSSENTPMPSTMAEFELVYFMEVARIFTSHRIVPLSVELPGHAVDPTGLEEHFGCAPSTTGRARLVLSRADADRPLVTENEEMWAEFERVFHQKLLDRDRAAPMSARVKSALVVLLPSGLSSVDAVCNRLHVSKRSLHRYLERERQSFQAVLDATRLELARHYLSNRDITIAEISHLLAFSDPNSFHRAFRGWTGMTPIEARSHFRDTGVEAAI